MKFLVALLFVLVVAMSASFLPRGQAASKLKCVLCEDVDTEKWVGKEDEKEEPKIIKHCEELLGGKNSILAKDICDDFLEKDLDSIIHHLENPENDPEIACETLKFC
uniref:Saposin B-type domain-containing protein n=1 Tax=Rhabditophanes sp. KR3021 TaxID=114890 RepID=A0AC35U1Z4_9BILA